MMDTVTPHKAGRSTEPKSQSFDQTGKSESAIRDAANALGQRAESVASSLADKADEAAAATGRGIESVADQIRSRTPERGIVGMASNKLADSLEYSGKYLEEQGLSGMTHDITSVVRRNPITSLLVGVGVGFLIARATNCRNT